MCVNVITFQRTAVRTQRCGLVFVWCSCRSVHDREYENMCLSVWVCACWALSGECRSACKGLLLKWTRHFGPSRLEPYHHTPWNLKLSSGSWAARVIRRTHHADGVTVWLKCPIRHTTDWPQPTLPWIDTLFAAPSLGQSQVAQGPLYRSLYGSHGCNLSIHLERLL